MSTGDTVVYRGDEYDVIKIDSEDDTVLIEDSSGYRLWVDRDKLAEGG